MSDSNQTNTINSTLNLLQHDLESADPAVAMAIIEQWENQLPGTELFDQLTELKQAILNGKIANVSQMLKDLSKNTSTVNPFIRDHVPAELHASVEQISNLLSEASDKIQ